MAATPPANLLRRNEGMLRMSAQNGGICEFLYRNKRVSGNGIATCKLETDLT